MTFNKKQKYQQRSGHLPQSMVRSYTLGKILALAHSQHVLHSLLASFLAGVGSCYVR